MAAANISDCEAGAVRRQYRRTSERRQEILQTVTKLLAEPGCRGVTTKDIARSMGIADGALYRHFSGRAEIFAELIGFCRLAFEKIFTEIDEQRDLAMLTNVKIKTRAMLMFGEANRGLARLLVGEALHEENPDIKQALRDMLEFAESAIRQTLENKENPQEQAFGRASMIMSYVLGRWSRFVLSGFEEKPTANWETAERILFS